MPDVAWLPFLPLALLVIATPGQDLFLVMSRSLAQGRTGGLATAAGVSVGLLGHTLLATLGLGAVLAASAEAYLALKLAGAAYLVYLGVAMLRTRGERLALGEVRPRPLGRLFVDGALSNLLNAKIVVFYLAFLPQFVAVDAARPALSVLALGVAFALLTFVVKGPVALFAAALSGWLRARPAALTRLYRTSGAVLVVLGLGLALERRAV